MTDENNKDVPGASDTPAEQPQVPNGSGDSVESNDSPPENEPQVAETPDADISQPEEAAAESQEAAAAVDEAPPEDSPPDSDKVVHDGDVPEDDAESAMLQMLEGLPEEEEKAGADDINFESASASNAEFQHLQQPAGTPKPQNIDLLMDVDLPVSIELGRTRMTISDILSLGPGSVVELNKLAGEPVDLLVNYKVVAKGEVVVVDENFGLRITQLLTPEERLKSLADE